MAPKSCQQRHHSYESDAPGAKCLGCGKVRGTRETRALGAGGAAALRASLGLHPQTDSGISQPPDHKPAPEVVSSAPAATPDLEPEPAKKRSRLWPRVARRLTQVFDAASDAFVEKVLKRQPNDAEVEDVEEFEEELAAKLAIWFPDIAMGPGMGVLMAGTFIVAEKAWNAERIAPAEKPQKLTTPITPQPPPPPAPPPTNGAHAAGMTDDVETLLHDLRT